MYNAFAHIDDIDDVLSNIVEILDNENPSIFRFEVQYVGALIDNLLIPSIFHEHISHYSLVSLSRFLSKHDFVMIDALRIAFNMVLLLYLQLIKEILTNSTQANLYINCLLTSQPRQMST